MERGLIAFVKPHPARLLEPRKDLDIRKLAALEALSRTARPRAACWAASP